MAVFTPLLPPRGTGRDLPKETNADFAAGDGEEIKLVPPPQYINNVRARYPFNKVTKHLDGSKIEFNTTPGSQYINIQTGDLKARFTLFNKGNVELRQLGHLFFHEIRPVKGASRGRRGLLSRGGGSTAKIADLATPLHQTVVVGGEISTISDSMQINVDRSYLNKNKGSTRFEAQDKFAVSTTDVEIDSKGTFIRGDVEIDGNLTVRGDLALSGELLTKIENISRFVEELDRVFATDERLKALKEQALQLKDVTDLDNIA